MGEFIRCALFGRKRRATSRPPKLPTQTNSLPGSIPGRAITCRHPSWSGITCMDVQITGVVTCFDAKTGKIQYSERLGDGGQGFTASPVAADHKLYFTSELGNVFVLPAEEKFSVAATNHLGETCMSTPAISAGTLFFRTREHLV